MGKSGPDTSGQNEAARMNAEIAKEVWENYKSTYLPMEKSYVEEASNYDTPEHREQAAQRASGDVEQAFAQSKAARAREMEGMGIRPDDAKFQAVNARLMRDKVAMQAGAQNMARQQVEQEGFNRKTGALSLGKGLPAQASNAAARGSSSARVVMVPTSGFDQKIPRPPVGPIMDWRNADSILSPSTTASTSGASG